MIYAIEYSRRNFSFQPALEEKIIVILDTEVPDDNENIEEFDTLAWNALWAQYPNWSCPFHAGNPPKTAFDKARHSFSSASQGKIREIA
jgi:hypothetical protein